LELHAQVLRHAEGVVAQVTCVRDCAAACPSISGRAPAAHQTHYERGNKPEHPLLEIGGSKRFARPVKNSASGMRAAQTEKTP